MLVIWFRLHTSRKADFRCLKILSSQVLTVPRGAYRLLLLFAGRLRTGIVPSRAFTLPTPGLLRDPKATVVYMESLVVTWAAQVEVVSLGHGTILTRGSGALGGEAEFPRRPRHAARASSSTNLVLQGLKGCLSMSSNTGTTEQGALRPCWNSLTVSPSGRLRCSCPGSNLAQQNHPRHSSRSRQPVVESIDLPPPECNSNVASCNRDKKGAQQCHTTRVTRMFNSACGSSNPSL